MQKHRTTVLMAVLLGLVGFYIYQSQEMRTILSVNYGHQKQLDGEQEPFDGENEIRQVSVKPGDDDSYLVDVNYRFRGDYRYGLLRVYPLTTLDASAPEPIYGSYSARRGVNTSQVHLRRDTSNYVAHSTRYVRIELFDRANKLVVASKTVEYPIDWPRLPYLPKGLPDMDRDVGTLYREAAAEIDYGTKASLRNAREILEHIVRKDARFVPVYVELARYHMKTNWGPEGRRQGERALKNGLAIDPNHANSYVLLGYVYAHQGRYQEAKDAFTKASEIGTDNLWLWANWGELLLMQGRVSEAIAMYNKAIEGERPYNTYDRARKDAYRHLIDIYALGNSIASADELHLKRTTEYRNEACFPYYYAKFRQRHFDDDDIVLEYARKALDAGCQYKASVRKVIGTAYYSKWNEASTPEDMQSYLAQAQSFFAEGPELIHWLSQSEKTVGLIKKLAKDGVSIDVTDNDGFTALAYAVRGKDPEAVKRLIAMGANPNATIGREKIPLLAVAVMIESKELVGYLIASGADVNAQVSEGVSLLDFANGMGYTDVAEVLRTAGGQRI